MGGISVAVLALLAAILLFSPVAHPQDLQVEGVSGSSAARIRIALQESAQGQSTFMVSERKLMAAVERFPEVAAIEVDAHPPFRLDLTVVMRPPVARLQVGGHSFVVAADGTVLDRAHGANVPRMDATISGVRVDGGHLVGGRGALRVLAAAPEELLAFARTMRAGRSGLEVVLLRGPRLIFGNASSAADKWAAAAAVIADGAAARATYIDLRVPSRPAVGGIGGSRAAGAEDAPPVLTAASPEAVATAATLTAGKAAATSGSATTGASSTNTNAQAVAPAASAPSGRQAEAADTASQSDTAAAAPTGSTGSTGASAPAVETGSPAVGATGSGGGASLGGGATP